MKIVWANRSEWKKPGPIVYIGLLNALSFAQLGYETHLFVSEGRPSNTARDLMDFYGIKANKNLHIHRIPKGTKISEIRGRTIYRQALAFSQRELEKGEELLFLTRELGLIGLLARLQRRFPNTLRTIYEAHDFHADLSGRDNKIKFTDHRKRLSERIFLPWLSGLLCITPPQEILYQKALPKMNILTLPLGCLNRPPSSEQEINRRRERRTLVYIGHLHRSKGIHDLLDQAAFFLEHNLKLHFVGGTPKQIEKLKKNLRSQQGQQCSREDSPIQFFPFMTPMQLHQHLENYASLGIVPLQDSYYNRKLTCPVKALDSLTHHLPVIVSDLPTTRAVLGDAGVYLSPNHLDRFPVEAIELIDDPDRYRQLSRNAARRAQELSWKGRAQSIINWC